VAVEMMMHALPLVVTATSGLNEVVDENSGLKVPLTELPDKVEIDTSLLAQKILHLLQNHGGAKKLGKNARKRFLEKFSVYIFRENMIRIYISFMR
jgi:glycosyltransferase involved in cell wall biosynthesis